jgi:hypothetical protein
MDLGEIITMKPGCFTKEKFIGGRTLGEIERILGYSVRRMARGITVVALLELPRIHEFDLAAYSNVPAHKFRTPTDLDIEKIKAAGMESWATSGFERVVKVFPATIHDANLDPDLQYPPGDGAPQWISKVPLRGKVVAIVTEYPNGRYVAGAAASLPHLR